MKAIKNNASIVAQGKKVNVPMLMFCSNGEGTGWDEEEWKKFQTDYISKNNRGHLIYLPCSHYVHNYEYEQIAENVKSFINGIHPLIVINEYYKEL